MSAGFKALLKDYFLNSSFAGLKYIAEDGRHWTERLFWIICVVASWYGSGLLILASWDAFQNKAISFGMETAYKDWNTDFPAVAVCENDNLERVYDASDSLWTPVHDIDLEEVLKELAYFRGLTYYTLQVCNKQDADPNCPKNNFTFYALSARSPCEQSIANCKYNGKSFDCCKHFLPIETDIGRCFVVNSIQTIKPKNFEKFPMVSNRKTGPGVLTIDVPIPATIYTLGEEEVPTLTTLQSEYFSVSDGVYYTRHMIVKNIENDPNARDTTIVQRNCRYLDENNLNVYPYYSYSACTTQCRKDAQRKLCNCSDHFMPNTKEENKCAMAGLVCLNEHYSDLSVIRPPWAKRPGLVCDCPPSCTEADLTVIKDDKIEGYAEISKVEIKMDFLPSERFKRNVVRSRLDLVVSTGGTTGLFVGASLLSFIEFFYYLIVRYYGTIYIEKQKLQNQSMGSSKNSEILMMSKGNLPIINIKRTRRELHTNNWQKF